MVKIFSPSFRSPKTYFPRKHSCTRTYVLFFLCTDASSSSFSFVSHSSILVFTFPGFLRRRQKKDKKKKADETGSEGEGGGGGGGAAGDKSSHTPTPDVDDEGFSRQPPPRGSGRDGGDDPWADFNQPSKNFYSSSDDSGAWG